MGSLGDNGNEVKSLQRIAPIDITNSEAQAFDSQSPSSLPGRKDACGNADELQLFESTVPFDDNVLLENAFETQLVNLGGETQVLDIDADEFENLSTQFLDECDTEIAIDSDGEGTGKTEVLSDDDLLLEVESGRRDAGNSVDGEQTHKGSLGRQGDDLFMVTPDAFSDERRSSDLNVSTATPEDQETLKKKSGSVPMGFASVRAASLRASGLAARNRVGSHHDSFLNDNESVKKHDLMDNEQSLVSTPKFVEEFSQEHDGNYSEKRKERDEEKCRMMTKTVRKLFQEDTLDDCKELAGLSYVDSQEPGESSQASALDFVDKFLKVNAMDFNQDCEQEKRSGVKSNPMSSGKGMQSLVKRAKFRGEVGRTAMYDWVDSREDEGGGDFFMKHKEVFFDGKGRRRRSFSELRKPKYLDTWGHRADFGFRDRDDRHNVNNKITGIVKSDSHLLLQKSKRENGGKAELDEMNIKRNLMNEMDDQLTVGFDTQMAAEAMEALCHGQEDFHIPDANNADKGIRSISKEGKRKRADLEQAFRRRSGFVSGSVATTRQSNQRKRVVAESIKELAYDDDKVDVSKKSTRAKKHHLEEEFHIFTPIACRTRQKQAKGVDAPKMLTSKKKSLKLDFNQSEEFGNSRAIRSEQLRQNLGFSYPRRRRSQRLSGQLMNSDSTLIRQRITGESIITRNSSKLNYRSVSFNLEISTEETFKPSASVCTTNPVECLMPNATPPTGVGNKCLEPSCKKNLARKSMMKEVSSLSANALESASPLKDSRRKRRDMANIRVLFSQHLDEEIIKHQKKILVRLGVSTASSMADATHFVADNFVRTRNMLEAIALGKPVVTHLWLESCGQANFFIDERNYILRDHKKEKEFGFSMPASLARACQRPLLQGQRVLITPNTKPGVKLLATLVRAVHGQALERIGRSAVKDGKLPDDLLVLSCEEDYEICVPFLEKGAAVYSSELLLNGVVAQRLDYERHCLFSDRVKRTRKTVWMRKDYNHSLSLSKLT